MTENITLKEYMDRRFEDQDKAVQAALAAAEKAVNAALISSEKAVDKAERNSENWRNQSNEWRGAMNDRERILMPRQEADVRFDALEKTIKALTEEQARGQGKGQGLSAGWGYLLGILALASTILGLVGYFIK